MSLDSYSFPLSFSLSLSLLLSRRSLPTHRTTKQTTHNTPRYTARHYSHTSDFFFICLGGMFAFLFLISPPTDMCVCVCMYVYFIKAAIHAAPPPPNHTHTHTHTHTHSDVYHTQLSLSLSLSVFLLHVLSPRVMCVCANSAPSFHSSHLFTYGQPEREALSLVCGRTNEPLLEPDRQTDSCVGVWTRWLCPSMENEALPSFL